MASYIIAGRADDPSFARTEFAAKQIEAACPNVFFRYEMKHPDYWKEFICSVFRQYDFHGYTEDFGGPLVWTHEGELVGGGAEFVQKVCIEKFGIRDPPSMSDPVFRQIAADNLKQVRLQQHREQNGPPFAEKCETAFTRALGAGLVVPQHFTEQRRRVIGGACLEVWVADSLAEEWRALREAYGDGQAAGVDAALEVGHAGQDSSHLVVVHPRPITRKQLVLVPRRLLHREQQAAAPGTAAEGVAAAAAAEAAAPGLQVPPHGYRRDATEEDLSLQDFLAGMEVMAGVPGIATWSGLREGGEYRHPLDTHLQVLPFPLHSQGEACPLRYPLELLCDAALREGVEALKVFPFRHAFGGVVPPEGMPEDRRKQPKVLAQAALHAYEAAKLKLGLHGTSCSLAFTATWLLLVPLAPPVPGSAPHQAWLLMPPPPPCALCGVVVSPTVASGFPETAGMTIGKAGGKMVSTRAAEEGIPEGTPEFEAASREVRIASAILDSPADVVGVWVA